MKKGPAATKERAGIKSLWTKTDTNVVEPLFIYYLYITSAFPLHSAMGCCRL